MSPHAGSSPHTRGAPPGRSACRSTGWDHPRIRGEHRSTTREKSLPSGSSPHTRGARGRCRGSGRSPRIIPAYAGSTRRSPRPCGILRDHPRIRGEHGRPGRILPRLVGSSPHTRGAPTSWGRPTRWPRIIPAYAGSTPPHPTAPSSTPDHPRIRGEHHGCLRSMGPPWGSSPHTRGARDRHDDKPATRRIIPAYAGSTSSTPGA